MQQETIHIIIDKVQSCTDEALLDLILKLLMESGY